MVAFYTPLVVGLLGSTHCLGMCGPLVLAYGLHNRPADSECHALCQAPWAQTLLHHSAFHLGRIFTYGVLGAVSAGLFQAAELSLFFWRARGGVTIVSGVLLLLLALALLRLVPIPAWANCASQVSGRFLGKWLQPLLRSRRIAAKVVLGMATGLLPCCLSWAMVVTAASTLDPFEGWLTMLMFGLGTTPLLFLTGLSVHLLPFRGRLWGERLAALTVMVMGLVLVLKGTKLIA